MAYDMKMEKESMYTNDNFSHVLIGKQQTLKHWKLSLYNFIFKPQYHTENNFKEYNTLHIPSTEIFTITSATVVMNYINHNSVIQ